MPAAVYPLLLLLVVFVLGSAFFKSELFGHFLLLAFAMALMMVITHYSELYVWGLAYQARIPWLRYFLARSAITAASIAPAIILGLVWSVRERVHSFAPMPPPLPPPPRAWPPPTAKSSAWPPTTRAFRWSPCSAPPTNSPSSAPWCRFRFSIAALRKARIPLTIPQPVRRAASALHGASDWLPLAAAKARFKQGGIIIGEACRPDLYPKQAGTAPLLRYDGNEGSGHLLVSPVPAATRPPAPWFLRPLNGLPALTQGWGVHGRQAWFDAAYLRLFFHIQDYEAADYLSEACGEFTALGDSITEGSGSSSSWEHRSRSSHQSTSRQQVARRLIKPEEVLHRLRYDEQIVLIQNAPPLRCGRAIYFRRLEMVARVKGADAHAGSWR
jgi:hypothetical protein